MDSISPRVTPGIPHVLIDDSVVTLRIGNVTQTSIVFRVNVTLLEYLLKVGRAPVVNGIIRSCACKPRGGYLLLHSPGFQERVGGTGDVKVDSVGNGLVSV